MASVKGPEIEDAAGDKGSHRIGADHPLAVLVDLAVTRGQVAAKDEE